MKGLSAWYRENLHRAAANFETVKTRIARGMAPEVALTKPVGAAPDSFLVFWRANAHRSLVPRDIARYRFRRGWSMEASIGLAHSPSQSFAYWAAHRQRAVAGLTFEMFRARVRRAWDLEQALTTPRCREWGAFKRAVLQSIRANPGIRRRELFVIHPNGGSLSSALRRLEEDGQVRREYERDGRAGKPRFFARDAAEVERARARRQLEDLDDEAWAPVPYVTPIRARALGMIA